jgi:predicted RecA/RadA family phage recombinase
MSYKSGTIHEEGDSPQVLIKMKATAARSKGDPVYIDMGSSGLEDQTIADDTTVHYLAVAYDDIASGDYGDYVVQGEVNINIGTADDFTAGHGLDIDAGKVEDSDAGFSADGVADEGQTDAGVVLETGTALTDVLVCLHGCPFTSQS